MNKDNENLNDLLKNFFDEARAWQAKHDIESGEQLLSDHPAPQPSALVTDSISVLEYLFQTNLLCLLFSNQEFILESSQNKGKTKLLLTTIPLLDFCLLLMRGYTPSHTIRETKGQVTVFRTWAVGNSGHGAEVH